MIVKIVYFAVIKQFVGNRKLPNAKNINVYFNKFLKTQKLQ